MRSCNAWPAGREPSLDELLSDPIAAALLRSDGLTRDSVEAGFARAHRAWQRGPTALFRQAQAQAAASRGKRAPVFQVATAISAVLEMMRADN